MFIRTATRLTLLALLPLALNGCTAVQRFVMGDPGSPREPEEARSASPPTGRNDSGEGTTTRRRRETVPPNPEAATATSEESIEVRRKALSASGTRIIVSIGARALWLMRGDEVLHSAPVAVGKHDRFTYRGKSYNFRTPVGVRKVLAKSPDPIWTPPDWHYFEKIVERGLDPVQLEPGMKVELEDGTHIEVRGDDVGRVNNFGNFAPFTPGNEIVFDGKLFIPPFGTNQRRIPEILGEYKLEMGDAYLIHGTPERYTIGEAVSHGCVRMYNEDVSRLYELVPVGTAIYIF